jgi:uncharacterized membrane protein YczE
MCQEMTRGSAVGRAAVFPPASASIMVRAGQLTVGLLLFGLSLGLMVRSGLGLSSWDVLHQGIARRTGIEIGWVVNLVGGLVLLLWIPLRQRPGAGTIANVAMVGTATNAALAVIPPQHAWVTSVVYMVVGILANGVATGLYIGAGLGPGPRDGLMTGLARRGLSISTAGTLIEVTVLGVGWALGGTVGIGTLAYALSIGPLAGFLLPRFTWQRWAAMTRAAG